jgi:hypothetical protein
VFICVCNHISDQDYVKQGSYLANIWKTPEGLRRILLWIARLCRGNVSYEYVCVDSQRSRVVYFIFRNRRFMSLNLLQYDINYGFSTSIKVTYCWRTDSSLILTFLDEIKNATFLLNSHLCSQFDSSRAIWAEPCGTCQDITAFVEGDIQLKLTKSSTWKYSGTLS